MASECEILNNIYTFYKLPIEWNDKGCLVGNHTYYETDATNTHIVKLKLRELPKTNAANTFCPRIFELKNLNHLSFALSNLSGEIPDRFNELPNLDTLSLRDNALTGGIPKSISTLKNLKNLFLQNNQLEGEIGDKLKDLKQLLQLDLGGNKFTGEIPNYIGDLTNLQNVNLSGNDFSGTLPDSVKNLNKIAQFDINNNSQLKGAIPVFANSTMICNFGNTNLCYKVGEKKLGCAQSIKLCSPEEVEDTSKTSPNKEPKGSSSLLVIGLLFALILIIVCGVFYYRKKRSNNKSFEDDYNRDLTNYNRNNVTEPIIPDVDDNSDEVININNDSNNKINNYNSSPNNASMSSANNGMLSPTSPISPTSATSPTNFVNNYSFNSILNSYSNINNNNNNTNANGNNSNNNNNNNINNTSFNTIYNSYGNNNTVPSPSSTLPMNNTTSPYMNSTNIPMNTTNMSVYNSQLLNTFNNYSNQLYNPLNNYYVPNGNNGLALQNVDTNGQLNINNTGSGNLFSSPSINEGQLMNQSITTTTSSPLINTSLLGIDLNATNGMSSIIPLSSDNHSIDSNNTSFNNGTRLQSSSPQQQAMNYVTMDLNQFNKNVPNEEPPPYIESEEHHNPLPEKSGQR